MTNTTYICDKCGEEKWPLRRFSINSDEQGGYESLARGELCKECFEEFKAMIKSYAEFTYFVEVVNGQKVIHRGIRNKEEI